MLQDASTTFPLFIDPAFNKGREKWAFSSSNNENNDTTSARVGKQPPDNKSANGQLYRSYFQFDTEKLKNTNVLDAHIEMMLDHSYDCEARWVHLYRTSSITVASGGRMNWDTRPLGKDGGKWLDSWAGHAYEGSNACSPEPDAKAVFDSETLREDLDKINTDTYTVGLCACNDDGGYEDTTNRWKRFYPDKTFLVAKYDLAPYKPVAQAFSEVTDCYKQCSAPAVVRTATPTLNMSVRDPFGGQLVTAFEVRTAANDTAPILVDSSKARVTTATKSVTDPGDSPAGTASYKVPKDVLAHNTTYYWRATTRDENDQWSGWSSWQSFGVDTVAPAPPNVSSDVFPFKQWGAKVETQGSFAMVGGDDVVDFTWSVDSGDATTVAAPATTPKTVIAPHRPSTDMVHTFHAKARDVAGNISDTFPHQFWVAPVPSRCWYWALNETSGTTAADTGKAECSPEEPTVTAVKGTVSGATFGQGWMGNGLRFTGSGQLTAGQAVVDTSKSFTVAAWVRPADLTAGDMTAISQDATGNSKFQLRFDRTANNGKGGWCFQWRADAAVIAATSACATGTLPDDTGNTHAPQVNTWVHVAGVYNAASGTIQLHVMGNPTSCSGEMVQTSAAGGPAGTGPLIVGRAAAAEGWRGDIDEVRVYPIALSTTKICQLASQ